MDSEERTIINYFFSESENFNLQTDMYNFDIVEDNNMFYIIFDKDPKKKYLVIIRGVVGDSIGYFPHYWSTSIKEKSVKFRIATNSKLIKDLIESQTLEERKNRMRNTIRNLNFNLQYENWFDCRNYNYLGLDIVPVGSKWKLERKTFHYMMGKQLNYEELVVVDNDTWFESY